MKRSWPAVSKAPSARPALNTVLHRLAVLSSAHQVREHANLVKDAAAQELVRRIRRAYAARGVRPVQKTALTRDPLERMLATCTDGLIGVRDRALLCFAFASGGRRRSEVARARMENLVKINDQTYLYRLTHSKADQAGSAHHPEADKPLRGRAAEALTAWLEVSAVRRWPSPCPPRRCGSW